MKAVIMAGGEGTRLRPLTCNAPKPMARLCGKPILEYIFDLLLVNGISESVITLGYLSDRIKDSYPNKCYKNMQLSFAEEEIPLGTAGGVKNAASIIDSHEILVISGDALCDFDLKEAYEFHRSSKSEVTIICKKVSDPREYGLITTDENMAVIGFTEKPGWNLASSGIANTGIYILNRAVLDLIPDNGFFDFAKDLFPLMLKKGMKITAKEDNGYWCDIGNLDTYLQCNNDLLNGKISFFKPKFYSGLNITNPVYIGKDVTISNSCQIGPNAILDDGVTVNEFSKIRSSIMLENSFAGKNTRLTGTIICDGASLKSAVQCYEGSVIGSGSVIGEKCEIMPGIKIWPGKSTEAFSKITQNLVYGNSHKNLFDDSGIVGELGVDITPNFTAEIGAACGSLKKVNHIGISCDEKKSSKALKMALCSGILGTGSGVWDFGIMSYASMIYSAALCNMPVSVYISGEKIAEIKILGEGGTPLSRDTERELIGYIQKAEFKRTINFKEPVDMSGIKFLYEKEMLREAPLGLEGISAYSEDPILTRILDRLGCDTSAGAELKISNDGCCLTISESDNIFLCRNQVRALCSIIEFEHGNNVSAPYDAPRILDILAAKYKKRVLRYFISSTDKSDNEAKILSKNQLWMNDGIRAAIKILYYLKTNNITLNKFASFLPLFETIEKSVNINITPSQIFEKIDNLRFGSFEGAELPCKCGSLFIRPSKRGDVLNIFAEAKTAEVANEICADIIEKIQKIINTEYGKIN